MSRSFTLPGPWVACRDPCLAYQEAAYREACPAFPAGPFPAFQAAWLGSLEAFPAGLHRELAKLLRLSAASGSPQVHPRHELVPQGQLELS
mmetsp:Transcript_14664/g.34837  ORF Transcript_14664/g.34837 Transcript_14664/m.34837 type:complete len:91 (+) Transcript_14664:139-411(+)